MNTENATISNEALLEALAQNPDAAHFLADLAAGGDLHQLIEAHFGIKPSAMNDIEDEPTDEPAVTTPAPTPAAEPEPGVGMYQSPIETDNAPADSVPTFLANIHPDFWGDMVIF